MFLRRRGLLFGCGSFLLICVATLAILWFVVLPRGVDALKDSVAEGISTVIADEIAPNYSLPQLQAGEEVHFSFDTVNRTLQSNRDANVDAMEITTEGDRIVMRATVNGQDFDIEFIPEVTADGRLDLQAVEEGNWFQGQVMDVMGGGVERAVNEWLERSGLQLTGVDLVGDGLVLHVEGQ